MCLFHFECHQQLGIIFFFLPSESDVSQKRIGGWQSRKISRTLKGVIASIISCDQRGRMRRTKAGLLLYGTRPGHRTVAWEKCPLKFSKGNLELHEASKAHSGIFRPVTMQARDNTTSQTPCLSVHKKRMMYHAVLVDLAFAATRALPCLFIALLMLILSSDEIVTLTLNYLSPETGDALPPQAVQFAWLLPIQIFLLAFLNAINLKCFFRDIRNYWHAWLWAKGGGA